MRPTAWIDSNIVSVWKYLLVACTGCGRIAFDEHVATDTRSELAPGVDCWPVWRSGAPAFASVAPITELADPEKDGNPWLAGDGRTLYWDNGTGDTEIYRADRDGPGMPFGPRSRLAELTSPLEETGLVITADDKVGIVASTRAGSQGFDLWQTTRSGPGAQFTTPTMTAFPTIDDASNQFDAFLTADGKRLYYATSTQTGQQLRMASRASASDAFGATSPVPGLGTFAVEADADLSPDELVVVFAANLPLTLYLAVRASPTAAFGPPILLAAVNGTNHDADPALSPDGCELLFISDRGGNRDLWRAVVTPP